ncbi:tetratricopeptide repeat protein [Nannocystis bainbridge]|uniref:Tetratricopeptide repeat protein n=1 Tax=Nannocystis bainbridge TaxID=2995303 RepID=A0ABT5EA84_9BACT|nr:tetratricopeptide repeat protein [Nannocystis bainbridge]MDC0722771.1 tetratricopeptide repeat protein [Nannocystis bainbridge]
MGCLNLGRSWLDGRQPGVNEANAIELFYKACVLADEDGCDELSRTVVRLRDVCDKGGPNFGSRCLNLGWAVERGLGVEHDVERAVALYKKACGAGVGQGCFNLGVMQAEGRGTGRDDKAAKVSFHKGCKLDHAPACARVERG